MSNLIKLLKNSTGETFLSTWIIVLNENYDYFHKILSKFDAKSGNQRAIEVMLTLNHESIHFLQALTTPFLYSFSKFFLDLASDTAYISRNEGLNVNNLIHLKERYANLMSVLKGQKNGVTSLEVIEGVAVLESYKLTIPDQNPESFADFLYYHFPGRDSLYTRTFKLTAKRLGLEPAYHLLSPISYLALQGDSPSDLFCILLDKLCHLNYKELIDLPIDIIAESLGYKNFYSNSFLTGIHKTGCFPEDFVHNVLSSYIILALKRFGPDKLVEFGARPHKALSKDKNGEPLKIEIIPPLVLFSGRDGIIKASKMGMGLNEPKEEYFIKVLATSLVGAMERLLDPNAHNDFVPCTYEICPVHKTGYCCKNFAIPSPTKGWERCGFPVHFQSNFGINPVELFKKLNKI